MYYCVEFGRLLRKHREEKKYTRETLAEICDISDRCISNIERGVSEPKLGTLIKLCKQCDIDMRLLADLNIDEEVHTDDLQLQIR